MAHWNTLEFISQMPNCANHPIYPTRFIPMENNFLELKIWKKNLKWELIQEEISLICMHYLSWSIFFPLRLKCKT